MSYISFCLPSFSGELTFASTTTGNAAGSFSAGWFIDRFGTKKTMWGLCLASTAFISIQVSAESRGQLLAGKMLNGAPQGAFIAVAASVSYFLPSCTLVSDVDLPLLPP